jgi:hypothetical protein
MRKVINGSLALTVAVAGIVAATSAYPSAFGFENGRRSSQLAEQTQSPPRPLLQLAEQTQSPPGPLLQLVS